MPGQMVHLAAARAFDASGDGLFLVANIAPDFTDSRQIKDYIHLRTAPDRETALRELRGAIDVNNPFELGWLLHLFADWRWDTDVIPSFRDSYTGGGNWFTAYRAELGKLSFSMYRDEPWSREVWAKIRSEQVTNALRDLQKITTVLPVPLELNWYRERVIATHERHRDDTPTLFTADMAHDFASETAERFKQLLIDD
ncbi:MAG: hypothetical protein LBN02_01055 [Oscillospiraceae bacterium]|jgi:hypothetical protein|nr:hypothetical protein [Oscillospiraceae bacterium]